MEIKKLIKVTGKYLKKLGKYGAAGMVTGVAKDLANKITNPRKSMKAAKQLIKEGKKVGKQIDNATNSVKKILK